MPRWESHRRKQKALLWPAITARNDYGLATVGPYVEVLVRWETIKGDVIISQGDTVGLDATAVVDREVPLGSQMWLAPDQTAGSLSAEDQWLGTGSGDQDTELMQVLSYEETPDLKGRVNYRQVGLQRARRTTPTTS